MFFMNKKREALFLVIASTLFIVLLSNFILAATNSTNTTTPTNSFDKSYSCLNNLVNSKISSGLTSEELSFSLLALSYDSNMQSKLKSKLTEQSKDGKCWPKAGCTLKDTSLALLAYNYIGADTSEIESWLLNQTQSPTDLVWYLQIDSDSREKAECTIKYDSTEKKVILNEDKTITGTLGGCLTSAYGGIWLEVSTNCYGKEFEISCNKDFITNTIYKKKNSQTIFVSGLTNSAAIGGKTTEKVESSCFKQAGACNYEGSLWASMALQKTGNEIRKFLPYLLTLSSDNKRFIPSAFLYVLTTGFDEYFTELINEQNKEGYWQFSDTSRRYYDTALSILMLGNSIEATQKAKDYLLQTKVQGEGCYNNNVRDTAFIVYASSPKPASTVSTIKSCGSSNYFCITRSQCDEVNGSLLEDYSCLGVNICCDKKYTDKSCSERSGKICLSTQECSGDWASGLTGCCLNGDCIEKQEVNECEQQGSDYKCMISCDDTQQSENYNCPEQGICCSPKIIETPSYWWIWLLVILIILLILAFLFRNQLKLWWFKYQSKFSKSPVQQQTRPSFPPSSMPPQAGMPRRIIPPTNLRPVQRPFPKDRELDETLRKLKDLSK